MADQEYPEGHDVLVQKNLDCPACGKDNMAVYADGHEHCFTPDCKHHTSGTGDGATSPSTSSARKAKYMSSGLMDPQRDSVPDPGNSKRNVTAQSLRKFGVFYSGYSGLTAQVYPYHNQDGQYCAQKLRTPAKDFPVMKDPEVYPGSLTKCQLFGQSVWGNKYDRQVVITEGELDAISVAQATEFRTAVVSINTGAGAAKDCLKANYLWLDRFKDIVLWMDDDEPGRKAAEECAPLFAVGKVRIVRSTGVKDASDLLKANRSGDIQAALYAAVSWKPRGIVNGADSDKDVLAPEEDELIYPYPEQFAKLNEMTGGGMSLGDVVYHVAGTGVGKSTALREIQADLIRQGVKIAVLSFEDTLRDMKMGLMSIFAGERLSLIPVPKLEDTKARNLYNAKMAKYHAETFLSGLVELFDPETAEWALEAILGYIRYCAKALECKVIFVDPISFVAAGIALTADERRVLDKVAAEFAKLAKELNIHLQICHHLKRKDGGPPHEEGAPTSLNELRSSGGLANFAMCVIGWERNAQAGGDTWRVTQSRILKPLRRVGKSGLADILYFEDTGRLVKSTIPFPPIGKPGGGDSSDQRGHRGFSPVASSEDY